MADFKDQFEIYLDQQQLQSISDQYIIDPKTQFIKIISTLFDISNKKDHINNTPNPNPSITPENEENSKYDKIIEELLVDKDEADLLKRYSLDVLQDPTSTQLDKEIAIYILNLMKPNSKL